MRNEWVRSEAWKAWWIGCIRARYIAFRIGKVDEQGLSLCMGHGMQSGSWGWSVDWSFLYLMDFDFGSEGDGVVFWVLRGMRVV